MVYLLIVFTFFMCYIDYACLLGGMVIAYNQF